MRNAPGYVAAILRQWPILLLAVALGVGGGFGYTRIATPVYSSTSQVLIAVESSGSTADRLQGATYIDQIIPTYTSAVTSSIVLSPVIKQLGLNTTLETFRKKVTAKVETGTALITITAQASTAQGAQEVTKAITQRFITIAPGLVSPVSPTPTPTPSPTGSQAPTYTATNPAVVNLSVVDDATKPRIPDSPNLLLGLALGLVAGLLAGIAIALARYAVDKRIRSVGLIEAIVGAPIVGRLPRVARRDWATRDDDQVWAESVRGLRSALFTWGDPVRTIQFCSATPGEGTSSTVVAIAESLAKAGVRAVAIDANLRSPSLHDAFGVSGEPGLAEVLSGSIELGQVGHTPLGLSRLIVVPSGTTRAAGDLVASDALRPVLAELSEHSDIVLLDTPAVISAGDALAIAHSVSSVVLVVAIGGVTEQVLTRTVEQLTSSGRSIAGVVVTRASRSTLNESASRVGAIGRG
ncbi:MAG: chromosome partitioning protein [Microbacteriaceae bacterium]|jgi:succinoglycan biosynthesis transport protein ExoP|nr:chromosome partitioning protein [Microbacteriaceae bacterium]